MASVAALAAYNDVTHPMLGDVYDQLPRAGVRQFPLEILIGPDLTVLQMGDLPVSDLWIRQQLDRHIGQD